MTHLFNLTVTIRHRDGREESFVTARRAGETEDARVLEVEYVPGGYDLTESNAVTEEYDAADWRIVDVHATETPIDA